jgi:hypothetical protein
MPIADRLVGSEHRRISALRRGIAQTLTETSMAEFVGAAKEFNRVVSAVRSERRLHGAVMLVAKWQDIRPHSMRV